MQKKILSILPDNNLGAISKDFKKVIKKALKNCAKGRLRYFNADWSYMVVDQSVDDEAAKSFLSTFDKVFTFKVRHKSFWNWFGLGSEFEATYDVYDHTIGMVI